jgi:hypothetical protein
MIYLAKKKGVNIALTDHNSVRSWKEVVSLGQKAEVKVIQGEEIQVFDEGKFIGELIGLFMNEFVSPNDYLEVIDALREQDALIVVPHPFDFLRGNFKYLRKEFKKIDCIESFNSRCYADSFNSKAKAFSEFHKLGQTAGSDAHFPEEIGNAFIEVKCDSLEEARKLLKKGKGKIFGKRSSVMVHIKTFFAKKGFFKAKNY